VEASGFGAATVTIEADGPLPEPRIGVLDGPPRIYLDFTGVTPGTRGGERRATPVRGLRVALHQPDPAITRVVIDLEQRVSHALDVRRREDGIIRVTVTADRERTAVVDVLAQVQRLRAVLSSIDSRSRMPEEPLRTAIVEFEAIGHLLASLPSDPMQQALTGICTLGKTAATLHLEAQRRSDEALGWNAASAAAGAIMLLDRLESGPTQRRPGSVEELQYNEGITEEPECGTPASCGRPPSS
jgi:hypothetical protein